MRIAIVALNAFPAVEPGAGTAIGGLETFAWSLARALARDPQTSVQFVVRHTAPPQANSVDGVQLLCDVEPLRDTRRAVSRDIEVTPSFPWLKLKRFRLGLLWQVPLLALSKLSGPRLDQTTRITHLLSPAPPDIVLALGVGDGTAAAVRVAKQLGVPAWVWWQSNADLNEQFLTDGQFVDPYGVTSADARASYLADGFINQTRWQQSRVLQLLQRESVVIPNPVDFERFPVGEASPAARSEVLWIGRYDRHHKRPHLALEIARLCPLIPFHLVINRGDEAVEREIRLHCPPNVRLTDYLSRDDIPATFRRARLFLSTGSPTYEGFPNVLLEAAASGTPIVSLEDFDNFIERSCSGVSTAGVATELAAKIRHLWEVPSEWHEHSRSGAEYVRLHHSLAECVAQFRSAVFP